VCTHVQHMLSMLERRGTPQNGHIFQKKIKLGVKTHVLEVAPSLYICGVPGGRCRHTLRLNSLVSNFKLDLSKPC